MSDRVYLDPLRGGRPVRITVSRRDEIKDAADDWHWIIRRDDLDVPHLVKLRLAD